MNRIQSLDGVRALAALVVVAFHCRVPGFQGGFFGVDVFFVLSGYLITSLLLTELSATGSISMPSFYWRRMIRLYPALLLMLVAFALVSPLAFPGVSPWQEIILPAFYVSNATIAAAGTPAINLHTWTLAMEVQFYLVWPVLLLVLRGLNRSTLTLVLATLYVAATLWRYVVGMGGDWARVFYAPDTNVSGLILGALLATLAFAPGASASRALSYSSIIVMIVLVITIPYGNIPNLITGTPVAELAAAMLILSLCSPASASSVIETILSTPAMVRLGQWSYGLYLWHYPIARVTREAFEPWLAFSITIVLSLPLAALSYQLVERPLIHWVAARRGVSSVAPQARPPGV